ncbi:MAG: tyrosine-type recombinase/integrase [Planctomycetes bacterium]|nr:tyrosine-type recombinase/integrase [Planctomycetota bacterium]
MIERYFCPRVATRLRASPDVRWLASFLATLDGSGYRRLTIQVYLREAELFGLWLRRRRRTLASVTDADIPTFATRLPRCKPRINSRVAIQHLLCHLRQRRLVPQRPAQAPTQIERIVTAYDTHLSSAAGLAPATRLYCRRYASEFLRSVFGTGTIHWSRLKLAHVRQFITGYGQTGRVAAARVAAGALRGFLRWLQFEGWIGRDLVQSVPHFRLWRFAALPPTLTDEQQAAILATFDRTTPTGCRAYAMALCLIDLGLRAGEVADLMLSDVDVIARTLRLAAGKPRRERILPLPERVHRAINEYIHQGRPQTTDQHLFVRHRPPIGVAVTRELVRGAIRQAYGVVPGCERLTGTHVLRHTTASRLLRAGADLKRIADILGHRSIDTTAIYAKVDIERLSAVTMPWPGVGEVQS